jgi:SAM-dependent methyltransferase
VIPESPLANATPAALQEELPCERIIEAYKESVDIDVSEYFEGLSSVQIYKCLSTGYRFYYPFHLAARRTLYEQLQNKINYYCIRREHEFADRYFKEGDRVLEIGCGVGLFMNRLREKGVSVTGLELNEAAVELGKRSGLDIENQDLSQHARENRGAYDVVCSFQVLEHVSRVREFIQGCLDALKPGGRLIVGVPNNNPYVYKYDKYNALNLPPHHMGLWDCQSLGRLQNVFDVQLERIWIEPIDDYYFHVYSNHLESKSRVLGLLARTVLFRILRYTLRSWLRRCLEHFVDGRNLVAVYRKRY